MECCVLTFIVSRMIRLEREDRARFLESPGERQQNCACESCSQPGLQPSWHVAAYIVMAFAGLPWYAAILHVLLLAYT